MPIEASVWYSDTSRSAMRSAARCPHTPVAPVPQVPAGPPDRLSVMRVEIGCDGRCNASVAAVEIALVPGSGLVVPGGQPPGPPGPEPAGTPPGSGRAG